MPRYNYKCKCGNEFEIICSMKDYESKKICPICGKEANRKAEDLVCADIWKCRGSYAKDNK